ncbi:hypothetical protein P9G84_31395 [Brevibacillus centrosporus]|uniref:hypothetical protein n=1 Tax=Brevibacillus centrosporus TaxID=54910 RepID=UPI001141E72E|nr:hypothetical protein [Brevibacillus centrosporus]MEC2133363.1 hypothetical protein [Brevibacillus centrosporus]GED34535.1 hypothetical protein BCE02nite_56760 [Brevibacillus centrosporus]
MRINNGRFEITNDILHMALFGGKLGLCPGYIYGDEFAKSRALLTHLIQEIFQIHRFPGFEEFYRKNYEFHSNIREAFLQLTNDQLHSAKEELYELYQFTQEYLMQNNPGQNYLRVQRSLNYFETDQIANQLLDRNDEIEYETNIVMSFATNNFLGSYGQRRVLLTLDVPFENILIHYDCLHFPNEDPFLTTEGDKEHEIWVLNTDPRGRLILPYENFAYENLNRTSNQDLPFLLQISEDFWNVRHVYNEHNYKLNKVWNDKWVHAIIKFRKLMGKI